MKLPEGHTRPEDGSLPLTFLERDICFSQKVRVGNVAIYERYKGENPTHICYEVVRIKRNKPAKFNVGDVSIEFKDQESYPGDSAWGKDGFSCNNLNRAYEYFDKFLAQEKEKEAEKAANPDEAPKRGRKALNVEIKWPKGEFTIKEVAALHPGPSPAYFHVELQKLVQDGKAKFTGSKKLTAGRGKPSNFYKIL